MQGWRLDYSRYQRYFLNIMLFYKKRADLQAFLEILLSLGATALFILLALRPTLITISSLLREIEEKEATIATMDQKIQNLTTAQSRYNQDSARIALLDTAIPTKVSPAEFLRQIEGVANKNSVALVGVTVGEIILLGPEGTKIIDEELKALPAGAESFNVTIVASGDYPNLALFIQDIENLRRPVFVDSFSINTGRFEDTTSLVVQIAGRTPFVKGETE